MDGLHFNNLPNSFSILIMYSLQSFADTPFPAVGLFGILLNNGNLLIGSDWGLVVVLMTADFGLLSSINKKLINSLLNRRTTNLY